MGGIYLTCDCHAAGDEEAGLGDASGHHAELGAFDEGG